MSEISYCISTPTWVVALPFVFLLLMAIGMKLEWW